MPGIKITDKDRQRIDTKFICTLCRLLLYIPMQTMCGHLMCQSCIDNLLGTSDPKCPEDGEELSEDKVFRDVFTKRELNGLRLHCANPGCSWQSTYDQLQHTAIFCIHSEVCEHAFIMCVHSQCLIKHKRSNLDQHLKSECKYRKVRCNYCGGDVAFALFNDHIDRSCENSPVPCKHCKKDFARKEIKRHEDTCGDAPVKCEFHRLGCEKKLKRSEKPQHDVDASKHHQRLLLTNFLSLESQQSKYIPRLEFLEAVERCNSRQKQSVDTLQDQMAQMFNSLSLNTGTITQGDPRFQRGTIHSYNGTLLWKIESYQRKRQDAINGVKTALYSPPFYSAQFGYKMCAKIYMNGDGFGKGSHLSLFFVVMRGNYDALQTWPFQKKITMMLLDQGNGDHMIHAFHSDPQSSSFQRPKSDMNIASGSPLFMPIDSLKDRQYIKDDVMFIKVIVD